MFRALRELKGNKSGVTLTEYALISGLISVVAITVITGMGTSVSRLFSTINSGLHTA